MHAEILSENYYSPVFIQWLDCVYQIVIQFIDKFEFKINLLEFIADNLYSGKYGTFLFNNDAERVKANAINTTVSIWTDVLINKENYFNPYYNKSTDLNEIDLIEPEWAIYRLEIWEEYYLKYNPIQNTHLGRWYTVSKDDPTVKKKYNNVKEFYYDDKQRINEEIALKRKELQDIEDAVLELIKIGQLNQEDIKSLQGYEFTTQNSKLET